MIFAAIFWLAFGLWLLLALAWLVAFHEDRERRADLFWREAFKQ